MFEKRTFVALGFLALVIGLAVYNVTRPDPHVRSDEQKSERKELPTFLIDQVDGLEIAEKDKATVVLARDKDGVWQLKKPIVDVADKSNVQQALVTLEKMRFKDVIAESESSHKTLQVLPEQVVTLVVKGAGKTLATMHVGRTGNTRLADSHNVWSVSGLNRHTLAREVRLWRNREIARFESKDAGRLDLVYPDGKKLVFAKNESEDEKQPPTWAVKEGQTLVGGDLDSQQVASAISMLSRLDAADFPEKTDAGATGLGAPRIKAIAHTGGKTHEIWIGNEIENRTHARREGSAKVWLINKSTADSLIKAPPQWRDKTIARVPATGIKRMAIKKGKSNIVLALQEDSTWKSVGPTTVPVIDPGKAQAVARALQNLRAQSIVAAPVAAKTGFVPPTGSLTLTDKKGKVTTVVVGALFEKQYHVKLAGKKDVYLVSQYFVEQFLLDAAGFAPPPPPPPRPQAARRGSPH